ncbi:SDR family NAD(P)-dependent oxidoreductase [Tritonibacter horizontis]|uniref:3-oxoacyl-[acyl-carrier-protein] reductase FabG n=1 Tax=Tritonibacter horizontis TaxID=1768241 RepID=A0A132BZL6_9RHOB|nr:SDR family oxidoreductase [Tritonibacter horizontis]KUP93799.1 3-oxoacyl-[acyl-carrier-protein] reductase FabG [Tritonibacter horizontis]
MSISGKHAFVTGGGTGIGLAIAQALAAAGAEVTITGRRQEVLEQVATSGLHPMAMDVRDEEAVRTTVARAVEVRGPVQICVANAGVAEGQSLHKMSLEFWRNMMATNLDGAFLTIRECLKSMHQTDWGRVLTISSIAGVRGLKGAPCYTASKHGLIGLTRSLSEDYLGTPITFNAICPGYVDTPIVARNTVSIADRAGIDQDAALQMMVKSNRHKRLIAPEEIAAAALWLCGPESQSVSGQTIEIAGGQT